MVTRATAPGRSRRRPTAPEHRVALVLAGVVLLGCGFGAGFAAARVAPGSGAPSQEVPADAGPAFGVFWEAWNLVRQHYVDQSAVDPARMTRGATQGMLDSLGDAGHTRFLTPQERHAEEDALAGRLEGIGATIGMRDRRPTILAPLPGSPAQRAGLRAGDVILRVDGTDTLGLPVEQITNRVRGPAGSPVTLSVIHQDDGSSADVTVFREQITVPSVTWAMLPGTTVAHVLVGEFADHAGADLARALAAARSAGGAGVVLDLRNDPGGLRDEAIAVASQFLRDGTVLIEQDAQGHRTFYPVRAGGVALETPLVLLVNDGTASSAEIVAGAIKDHHRASLVGTTSFGTGTVLTTFPLTDGSAVLIGTQEWLTPSGAQIWHRGITPDIAVALPAGAAPLVPDAEAGMTPEGLGGSGDSQLLRALQEVQGLAGASRAAASLGR